jgi:hypothetical protein
MEPFRAESIGIAWNPNIGATRDSILNYEQYNGRINILEDSDPEIRFQMTEKIAIKIRQLNIEKQ